MRITGVSSRIIRVPTSEAYVRAGTAQTWDYAVTTISTDEGVEGHSMMWGVLGEGRGSAYHLRDVYGTLLDGADPLQGELLWQRLMQLARGALPLNESVVGTIDVAIWDIRGKAAGQSVATLLGQYRDRVPTYASGSPAAQTPDEVAAEVAAVREAGYHAYKCLSTRGADLDIPCLRAARDAVPGFTLMADGSGRYTYGDAVRVGRVLDELEFHWFEEPMRDQYVSMLRRLAAEIATPVLATEKETPLAFLPEYVKEPACDLLRGDVITRAGITGLRKAAVLAEFFGMNLEVHTTITPLLDIAGLHVAGAARNNEFMEAFWDTSFRWGMRGDPLWIDADGYLQVPSGPGLGVELDWDWIDDRTIEVI